MKQRWNDLDPTVRTALIAAAVVDGAGRIAALLDLARRPADQVNGSKVGWGAALAVVNSAGILPAAYFLRGRR